MKKSFALLLTITMCFSSLPGSVISAAKTVAKEKISTSGLDSLPKNIKNVLKTDNVKGITDIGKSDLYSIDVVNSDGQHTVCTYQFPVKYIKDDGSIQYIDNSIISHSKNNKINGKSYAYKNKGNKIKTYFPENIKEGVLLNHGKYQVSFSPTGNINNAYAENKEVSFKDTVENVIEYSDVFGEGTKLQYSPTFTGVKENIVLEKYTGNNIFKFTINTNGLVPASDKGSSIALKDPSTGEVVSILGQVDAQDSYKGINENNDKHFTIDNKLSISPAEDDNTYVLTVTVDKDFLESDTTVYPVVIDPILSVYSSNHMDTTIYAAQPNTQNSYADAYNYVGNRGGGYGDAVTLVKFNFNSGSLPTTINPDAVTKAEYFVYEASGTTGTAQIDSCPIKSAWSDTTVTYNSSINNSMRDLKWALDNKIVKSSGWYKFNLTYITQGWLRDYYNNTGVGKDNKVSNYGFSLYNYHPQQETKYFCSAQNTTHPPRLEITYSTSFPIDNMSFTYDPSRFNHREGLMFRMNCYAYAMRIIAENTGSGYTYALQPGELSSTPLSTPYTLNGIYQAVSADLAALGFQIQQTTAAASVPSGWRKIAFAIDADSDYHFYVRHSDGTWSHKMGGIEASNLDANGVVINDSNIETISKNYSSVGLGNYSDGTSYVLINKSAILDFVNTTFSSPSIKSSERAGDTFMHSKPVGVGSTTSARFDYGIENFQDVDFYKIVISTTGNYSFYTTGNTDTVGQLFSSNGTRLAYNDDYNGVNFKIGYTNLAAGTYFVKIHPHYLSDYGSYSFVVTKN